ncbi:MAG: hypothetical protein P8R42_29755 [Candidatus Binatia bacterium]|nr:hypothetical protein [Candidatus Binatia bacterium]
MNDFADTQLLPLAPGIILSLLSIFFGFVLGALFGALESGFKPIMRESGKAVLDTVYGGDAAKLEAVISKAWKYAIRGHIHGGAIGTSALACILLLALLGPPGLLEKISATSFGAGSLIYSSFWLVAAFKAPAGGKPKQTKEELWWIAMPGAGLCLIGLVGTLISVCIHAMA